MTLREVWYENGLDRDLDGKVWDSGYYFDSGNGPEGPYLTESDAIFMRDRAAGGMAQPPTGDYQRWAKPGEKSQPEEGQS